MKSISNGCRQGVDARKCLNSMERQSFTMSKRFSMNITNKNVKRVENMSQNKSILYKFSKYRFGNFASKKSLNNRQSCFKTIENTSKQCQLRGKNLFCFLQTRLYNRPWSRPPSYTQSSNQFNWRQLHPNNLFGDLPPIIRNLIYINIGIFIVHSVMPGFAFRHFTFKYGDISRGRIYTPFTALFSHKLFFHLLFNMLMLYYYGPVALRYMSKERFYLLFFGSGVLGSLMSGLTMQPNHCSLGASGSIYGLLAFLAMKMPQATLLLWFVLPMRMWQLLGAIVLIEGMMLSRKLRAMREGSPYGMGGTYVSHEAHLTGVACGIAYYFATTMM